VRRTEVFRLGKTEREDMKIKDKNLKKLVDVAGKDCPNRPCYWPREDPGVFNIGQGYKFRSNNWLCGKREIKGCPDEYCVKESAPGN